MLSIRITLGSWILDCDLGPRPEAAPEAEAVDASTGFGFEMADEASDPVFRDLEGE